MVRVSEAGVRRAWVERAGDTRSGCSVDNQTLYCLSYIRCNTVKTPSGTRRQKIHRGSRKSVTVRNVEITTGGGGKAKQIG